MRFLQRMRNQWRTLRRRFADPKKFVKTDEISGQLQFEILKKEGCQSHFRVLEIGCGCLHAGVPLMQYLDVDGYVGVDPNSWLIRKALKNPLVRQLVDQKKARFLNTSDFDASSLDVKFNLVLSHSVLSHAAAWQLDQFLTNTAKVLAPGGRIVASLRLAEGNAFGSAGSPDHQDSNDTEWQYPGVSWFRLSTVQAAAAKLGLKAVGKPEYTEFYTRTRPKEFHDWIVFTDGK